MGLFDTVKIKAGELAADAERAGKIAAAQTRTVVLQNEIRKAERELGHATFALIERGEIGHPDLELAAVALYDARQALKDKDQEIAALRGESRDGADVAAEGVTSESGAAAEAAQAAPAPPATEVQVPAAATPPAAQVEAPEKPAARTRKLAAAKPAAPKKTAVKAASPKAAARPAASKVAAARPAAAKTAKPRPAVKTGDTTPAAGTKPTAHRSAPSKPA